MPNAPVFLVDDDAAVRDGLSFLLRTAGYDTRIFPSAMAFLGWYTPERGGCLLLDVQMPSMSGLEVQRELNRRCCTIPVIFITGHATIQLAIDAIKAGAFHLIEKPVKEDVLLDCVQRALQEGQAARSERLLRAQMEARAELLSPREREVLALVGAGEPNKVIARELGISFRTVEVHRANIIQKLQARGPADLIRLASLINPLRSG
jgi:two-component system response regulator FixJ